MSAKVYRFLVEFDIKSSSKEEAEYNMENWKRSLETSDLPMQTVGYRLKDDTQSTDPEIDWAARFLHL